MKIAIVGGGVSGNMAAHLLHPNHDITLFEEKDYLGGHTHTHELDIDGRIINVDSGFIVFNDWTYPNFIQLLNQLGVESQPSSMSFSVRCEKTGLEYNGSHLNGLFCQRSNLLDLGFHGMILDIIRFNRLAKRFISKTQSNISLEEFLNLYHFGKRFIDHYLVPMGAAIWSTDPTKMMGFPAVLFIRFLSNHGMLNINHRPQWRTIKGGSKNYLKSLSRDYEKRIRLNHRVVLVKRNPNKVGIVFDDGHSESFDQVFLCCHSDQALSILDNPTPEENRLLQSLPYQKNRAVMHTDTSILPQCQKAWAAWNYHLPSTPNGVVGLTYHMNILQNLETKKPVLVSLNQDNNIDDSEVIKEMEYEHPLFSLESFSSQQQKQLINGKHRTWYCGAYWANGFHEDGVVSALESVHQFEKQYDIEQQYIRRAS